MLSSRSQRYLRNCNRNNSQRASRVGAEFQADIPGLGESGGLRTFDKSETLLWNPSILPPDEVKVYLYAVRKIGWRGYTEEKVLNLLHRCGYDKKEALRCFRNMENCRNRDTAWSLEECCLFEDGLAKFGKNFHEIQKMLQARSVFDVSEFYYAWKKSERYDAFITKPKSRLKNSRYRSKAGKKVHRSIGHADVIMDKELETLERQFGLCSTSVA